VEGFIFGSEVSNMTRPRQPEAGVVLLAEDREDDVILVREGFAHADLNNPIYVVRDGEEAIQYLGGMEKYSDREKFPMPDLLLLDLKMPKIDGFEVLKWVRAQPEISTLRVVVLTSSAEIYDVNKAYALGANSFLVKPMDFKDYTTLSRIMAKFWFELSQAPSLPRKEEERWERKRKKVG
jgi:CheY-like chemotaxis protein